MQFFTAFRLPRAAFRLLPFRMLKSLLGALWRGAPRILRLWSVRLVQPRFTVTVAAVVSDDQGRVLLLKHVFRIGSGWGIPGGFIEKRENPEDALRRELAEEIGLELESAQITLARTLKSLHQIEIIFRCKAKGVPTRKSLEIARYDWFAIDSLPKDISPDQRRVIERVMNMPGNAVTSRP